MLIKLDEAIAAILAAGYEGSQGEAVVEINDAVEALRALPVSDGVTDEMVERAARAMAIADKKDPDADFRMQGDVFLTVATDTPQIWRTYARKARAALEAAFGATVSDGWEDIATAPRDGTPILLIGVHSNGAGGQYIHGGSAYVAMWMPSKKHPEHSWMLVGGTRFSSIGFGEPTHWRPLPAPPTIEGDKQ